jgi:hypothetical protein
MWRAHVPDAARVPEEGLCIIRPRFPLTVQNKATVTLAVVPLYITTRELVLWRNLCFLWTSMCLYPVVSVSAYLSFFVLMTYV